MQQHCDSTDWLPGTINYEGGQNLRAEAKIELKWREHTRLHSGFLGRRPLSVSQMHFAISGNKSVLGRRKT
ncbi:uncharacterized protein RSE6_03843 [Rhynchosporium secalis]|uniref:Uncharacterized protein n=1 Tax=Rhynchosporium secalis TaxID=38038 RepID=A0A1E1M3S6_RHYSE|nr:uncharacterized protein RSE6_03843 [Rhynchosporium secalis]